MTLRQLANPTPLAALLAMLLGGPGCGSTSTTGGSGGAGAGGFTAASGGVASDTGGATSETGGTGAASGASYLKASNTGASDLFGVTTVLSADGTTLIVGASGEASDGDGLGGDPSDDTALGAGAVYVYERSAAGWGQTAYLKASNSGAGDGFGTAVALSADGNTLAVGAPFESGAGVGVDADGADDSAPLAGAVYVFVRSGVGWTEQAYLKASNGDAEDYFGISLALSADGDVLVVGAEGEDGAAVGIDGDQANKTESESGAVYVFSRAEAAWTQSAYLKASNTDAFDHFGGAIALSADGAFLAAGAYREDSGATGVDGDEDDETASSAGAVYLFEYGGTAWQQSAYLKPGPNDGSASDNFGCSLSLSSDATTIAVGAVGDPSASTGVDGDPAGNTMAYSGAVYLFDREGESWQQAAYLKASNTGAGDEFGYHLHLAGDGNTLAVGAALEGSSISGGSDDDLAPESGAAYVFVRAGTTFEQTEFLKAPNAEGGDRFGWALALSADGSTLVVGASRESSAATGIDGDQSDNAAERAGAAYVFAR